jgi:hypothetical protein
METPACFIRNSRRCGERFPFVPAKAGTQRINLESQLWIPAYAGVNGVVGIALESVEL